MTQEQCPSNQGIIHGAHHHSMMPSLLPVGLIIAFLCWPSSAIAFSIEEVSLMPSGTIWPSDEVTLEIQIMTPSMPEWLYLPTDISVGAARNLR